MRNTEVISLQKLFVVTIVLKIVSSTVGWVNSDPWIFGLAIPVAIMGCYVLLGIRQKNRNVSDEKFADSCYYLGFIFTVTSIIFCLFDLPNIGAKLSDIAVRFGAAMVTTVIGLIVRVSLVNFKENMEDATAATEQSLIEASSKLREQLTISLEKLQSFESQVDVAARGTVERVNLQIEAISKSYGEKLEDFFDVLSAENTEAVNQALDEVKEANLRLSAIVDIYSNAVHANLRSVEHGVVGFTDAVTNRLKATTFPDDYFARSLAAPVAKLRDGTDAVSAGVFDVAGEIKTSTVVLAAALKSLRTKATQIEGSFDRFSLLASAQEHVLAKAESQSAVLSELTCSMQSLNTTLAAVGENLSLQSKSVASLAERIDSFLKKVPETGEHATTMQTQTEPSKGLDSRILAVIDGITGRFNSVRTSAEGVHLRAEIPLTSDQVIIPVYSSYRSKSVLNGDCNKESDSRLQASGG